MIRPGAALYGFTPNFLPVDFIKQIAEYHAPIIQVRCVAEDSFVGYDATVKVKKGTKLAVIGAGYADGYLRNLSNLGYGYLDEYKAPIVGRISMDTAVLDVSLVPDNLLYEGAMVELMGPNCTIEKISNLANVCGWEVLTTFGNGKRYNRLVF